MKRWLGKHPRFHIHFTPTSAFWLNMIERLFAEITRKRIRRGVFQSVKELEAAIYRHLEHHKEPPKPLIWSAAARQNHRESQPWAPSVRVATLQSLTSRAPGRTFAI